MTTTDSKVQLFFENNRKFAETYQVPPTMVQLRAGSADRGGALIICPFPVLPSSRKHKMKDTVHADDGRCQ